MGPEIVLEDIVLLPSSNYNNQYQIDFTDGSNSYRCFVYGSDLFSKIAFANIKHEHEREKTNPTI